MLFFIFIITASLQFDTRGSYFRNGVNVQALRVNINQLLLLKNNRVDHNLKID